MLYSLEFAMSIVWLILMVILGVLSKIFSDREKSVDKLWEDGGWKRKSSGSWNLWTEQRSQEEQFEAALKQEARVISSLDYMKPSKSFELSGDIDEEEDEEKEDFEDVEYEFN